MERNKYHLSGALHDRIVLVQPVSQWPSYRLNLSTSFTHYLPTLHTYIHMFFTIRISLEATSLGVHDK